MVISRRVYKFSKMPDSKIFTESDDVLRCVISLFQDEYYMYIETKTAKSDVLKNLDDKNRLHEIFHFCPDEEAEKWIAQRNNEKTVFCFAWLKPEMIPSYIYYHFALQEETQGERIKYYSIFISGNMLINFYESPFVMYDPKVKGKLDTSISKRDDWNEFTKEHFIPGKTWMKGEMLVDYSIKRKG